MLFFLYLIKNIFENRARVVPFLLDEICVGNRAPFYLINRISKIGFLLLSLPDQ
jgi:hypothetical protein